MCWSWDNDTWTLHLVNKKLLRDMLPKMKQPQEEWEAWNIPPSLLFDILTCISHDAV